MTDHDDDAQLPPDPQLAAAAEALGLDPHYFDGATIVQEDEDAWTYLTTDGRSWRLEGPPGQTTLIPLS